MRTGVRGNMEEPVWIGSGAGSKGSVLVLSYMGGEGSGRARLRTGGGKPIFTGSSTSGVGPKRITP